MYLYLRYISKPNPTKPNPDARSTLYVYSDTRSFGSLLMAMRDHRSLLLLLLPYPHPPKNERVFLLFPFCIISKQ